MHVDDDVKTMKIIIPFAWWWDAGQDLSWFDQIFDEMNFAKIICGSCQHVFSPLAIPVP